MKILHVCFLCLLPQLLISQTPKLIVPIGHTKALCDHAFSPDGKFVLTASDDQTAKLWDAQGREISTFAGHTSGVSSVAFSPDGQRVLTGSWDGTAKLWDLQGRELLTFKGHINGTADVAFSPDGKSVLTGGLDHYVRLWDVQGNPIRAFNAGYQVRAVAFSPDGKFILGGLDTDTPPKINNVVLMWDLQGRLIQTFKGHNEAITDVAFTSDGQQVVSADRVGTVKRWNPQGQALLSFTIPIVGAGYNNELSFSPDGRQVVAQKEQQDEQVAIGIWDMDGKEIQTIGNLPDYYYSSVVIGFLNGERRILIGNKAGQTLCLNEQGETIVLFSGYSRDVKYADFTPVGKRLLFRDESLVWVQKKWEVSVSRWWEVQQGEIRPLKKYGRETPGLVFSPDGQQLVARDEHTARVLDVEGKTIRTVEGMGNWLKAIAYSADGSRLLIASQSRIRIWDAQGAVVQTFDASSNHSILLSPDGKRILADMNGSGLQLWDVASKKSESGVLTYGNSENIWGMCFSPSGQRILTGGTGASCALWDASGRKLADLKGHSAGIYTGAISPDEKWALTGSWDHTAKLWDLQGREMHTLRGHKDWINHVAFSPDGKQAFTCSVDHTVKIWDVLSGKELATIILIGDADWAVTAPGGLFDASPGAMVLMHFAVGLEAVALEQLKERYFEPGLLGKVLGENKDASRSAIAFDQVLLYPEMTAALREDKRMLDVSFKPRNGGMGKLSVFVNNKEVREDANPDRALQVALSLSDFAAYYIPGQSNKIVLRVYNQEGWLKSDALEIDYQPPPAAKGNETGNAPSPLQRSKPPGLYAIVVGTANYAGENLDLQFSDRDATAFSQALRATAPKIFGDRVSVTLLNTDPNDKSRQEIASKASIQKAFADIAAKAQAQDVLVIYFSGHGVNYGTAENSQFYYLTKDVASENLSDPVVRQNFTISSTEFTEWIKAIPALKQVLVLDACNSGKIVQDLASSQKDLSSSQIRALDRMKDRTGMFILTGSAADKVSYEATQYGQGLLTYSILLGMSGMALTDDKRVDIITLFQYARDKVPELAKGIGGIQTPILAIPASGASFDIGIVDGQVRIPLAQVKPVFVRNVFQDEDSFDDSIGLTDAFEAYFREATVKDAQADIIYVDVKEYENAYSLKGRYKVSGDTVEVRGRLFKGKTAVGEEFKASGKKDQLPALVEAILEQVRFEKN